MRQTPTYDDMARNLNAFFDNQQAQTDRRRQVQPDMQAYSNLVLLNGYRDTYLRFSADMGLDPGIRQNEEFFRSSLLGSSRGKVPRQWLTFNAFEFRQNEVTPLYVPAPRNPKKAPFPPPEMTPPVDRVEDRRNSPSQSELTDLWAVESAWEDIDFW